MRLWIVMTPVVAGATALAPPARAAESFDSCTQMIETLPVTITEQGTWCLPANMTFATGVSDTAIRITSNNVVLDCNGYRLRGLDNEFGRAGYAVLAYGNNITVRNCVIEHFSYSIDVRGKAVIVEDNRVSDVYDRGINVGGEIAIVRRNIVDDIRGHDGEGLGWAFGISAFGSVDVIDNTISRIHAGEGSNDRAWGIFVNYDDANTQTQVITGNRIRDVVADGTEQGFGIELSAPGGALVRNNVIVVPGADYGIFCYYPDRTRVSENVVLGPTEQLVWGCPESTGNVAKH